MATRWRCPPDNSRGLRCKIGSAQVQFSCDARIGEGVSPLLSTLDVEVVAGEAVNLKMGAATPTEKA
jgi:hypothetical protein